ncbi:T9SS type A sorting domain-containing protein [Aequorivita sp. Q41]|uniref:T9SS type A sorting domain-containing protein n=1 Tax=Aequorivita sp. Q41 TaxID=3153300 RepID=UPI003242E86C
MKKITLALVAVMLTFAAQSQTILTQSADPVNVVDGGVACWDNVGLTYSENSFFRAYYLTDFGVNGDFAVSEVQYGQGSADDGKLINLNIYTADTDDLAVANLNLIASTTHTSSSADDLSLVTVPMTATIPAGSIVVFEVNAPSSGTNTGETFFPGVNNAGEDDDSYLSAVDCAITEPTTTSAIGFPDNQYLMNVVGDDLLSVGENLAEVVSVYPSPATDVLNIKLPTNIEVQNSSLVSVLGKTTGVTYSNGTMNVSGIAPGVYFLTLDTNLGSYTQKVIKQ